MEPPVSKKSTTFAHASLAYRPPSPLLPLSKSSHAVWRGNASASSSCAEHVPPSTSVQPRGPLPQHWAPLRPWRAPAPYQNPLWSTTPPQVKVQSPGSFLKCHSPTSSDSGSPFRSGGVLAPHTPPVRTKVTKWKSRRLVTLRPAPAPGQAPLLRPRLPRSTPSRARLSRGEPRWCLLGGAPRRGLLRRTLPLVCSQACSR